ncbi:MAG: YcbK family protein [Dissulfurispiraceae bacterium]
MHLFTESFFNRSYNRRLFIKASIIGLSSLFCRPAPCIAREKLPEGKLTLFNVHTNDKLSVTYRNAYGEYDTEALKALNWILRCHYSGQAIDIDTHVIEFVNLTDKQLGGNNEIHIISGYRSPQYNELLMGEGRHVVKNSLHIVGKAIDIRIPRVALSRVRDVALDLRLGGVGYYRHSDFVHLDCGRFRTW